MYQYIFIYGFSIFSMFFGSGNLVFPLQIGIESGEYWFLGFLGLFFTGVLLPFLGLFVIKLHSGNFEFFFGEAGRLAQKLLPLFTLSLLGAFGVIPRCITVAYGGIEHIFPNISLLFFSIIFCVISFTMCLNDKLMITMLGKWLTPILLLFLIILIGFGIINAPDLVSDDVSPEQGFLTGFFQGYETMDLFAAFFFSALVFKQLQGLFDKETDSKIIIKFALKPSLVGALLLSIIYLGFVFLGAHYRDEVINVAPELILPTIASNIMGKNAAFLIGVIVFFSCITTAVALNNIYARYICTFCKLEDRWFPIILLVTSFISFLISLLDFRGIAEFLAPVLTVSYPSLIALTFLSLCIRKHYLFKTLIFYAILIGVIIFKFIKS